MHIVNLKQYDVDHNKHGIILDTYQRYILPHFEPNTLIYMLISWDFMNFNIPNTVKYPNCK